MLKRSRSGSSLIWKAASLWILICVCISPVSTLHGQPVLPGNPPFFQNQNSDKLIVFIHGVNGDPRDTWTYKDADPNFFWPQQLANDPSFHNADVLSFGYASECGPTFNIREIAESLELSLNQLLGFCPKVS